MITVGSGDKLCRMKINAKFVALITLVLVLGFGAGYLLSLEPEDAFQNPDLTLSVDPQCTLNEAACSVSIARYARLKFAITPRPILGASPLNFNIRVEGIDIQDIALELSGASMNMGRYRQQLKSQAKGEYLAQGSLPVCVRNQMQWQADIWLRTRELGLVKVPYQFTAYKR